MYNNRRPSRGPGRALQEVEARNQLSPMADVSPLSRGRQVHMCLTNRVIRHALTVTIPALLPLLLSLAWAFLARLWQRAGGNGHRFLRV